LTENTKRQNHKNLIRVKQRLYWR